MVRGLVMSLEISKKALYYGTSFGLIIVETSDANHRIPNDQRNRDPGVMTSPNLVIDTPLASHRHSRFPVEAISVADFANAPIEDPTTSERGACLLRRGPHDLQLVPAA